MILGQNGSSGILTMVDSMLSKFGGGREGSPVDPYIEDVIKNVAAVSLGGVSLPLQLVSRTVNLTLLAGTDTVRRI